jgi:hypothetical protein
MTPPTVPARLKLHTPGGRLSNAGNFVRILCGRETRPGQFDCRGELGRIYHLDRTIDADPADPRSYATTALARVRPAGRDAPSIGGHLLSVGLTGLETATVTDLGDGIVRIWVTWHERGYQCREDGDYQVLAITPAWRLTLSGRSRGRSPLPEAMVEPIGRGPDSPLGKPDNGLREPDGRFRGTIGARPVLPAVIICPRAGCSARNEIPPPSQELIEKLFAELTVDELLRLQQEMVGEDFRRWKQEIGESRR